MEPNRAPESPFPPSVSAVFDIKEHVVPGQHIREYPRATTQSQEDVLYLCAKQYIPKDNPDPQPGDVTIIAAHANGFPKELYEAMWEDLLAASKSTGFRIRSIWMADVAWQGASGLLNQAVLGNDHSWWDHPRDLMCLINHFRAEMPRPLVGVGHSFGANCLVNLSLAHPRLLSTLVLFDATILSFTRDVASGTFGLAALSLTRRNEWDNRGTAVESFAKSKFMKPWDPRVRDAWANYGIVRESSVAETRGLGRPGGEKMVLTTPRDIEVLTYTRPTWRAHSVDPKTGEVTIIDRDEIPDAEEVAATRPPPRWEGDAPDRPPGPPAYPVTRPEGPITVARLPYLRPSVFWVYGGESGISRPHLRAEKITATGVGVGGSGGASMGRVADHVIEGVGHLIPMERPRECARLAAGWIGKEIERWREGEARKWSEWKASDGDKRGVDDKSRELIRGTLKRIELLSDVNKHLGRTSSPESKL